MTLRQEKVQNELRKMVSEFISRESNRMSMITVTRVSISGDLKFSTVYVTVLPKDKEEGAMKFLERQAKDIRAFVKKRLPLKRLPFFVFKMDDGEYNRQKIDDLLNNA